jgi:hypothetical protein
LGAQPANIPAIIRQASSRAKSFFIVFPPSILNICSRGDLAVKADHTFCLTKAECSEMNALFSKHGCLKHPDIFCKRFHFFQGLL